MKYAFVRAQGKEFAVKRMCQILEISRSGYYDWASREESKHSQQDRVLLKEIRKVHQQMKEARRGERCNDWERYVANIGWHGCDVRQG